MMIRLVTSKATSQMGARCRISLCVRTEAISLPIAECQLPIYLDAPRKIGNWQSAIKNSLHAAHHRVFPLHTLEQIEVRQHFAGAQHDGGKRIVSERYG